MRIAFAGYLDRLRNAIYNLLGNRTKTRKQETFDPSYHLILNSHRTASTKLGRVWGETLIKSQVLANKGEKSRANAGRMCLRSRRDPRWGSLLTQRGWHSAFAGKRDPTRELLVQTGPGFVEGEEPQVESVKRRRRDVVDSRARQASQKNTRSLGDASSVLVVANGISNTSRDGRFSMGASSSSYTTSLRARERIFGTAPVNTVVNCGNRSVTPNSVPFALASLRKEHHAGVVNEMAR